MARNVEEGFQYQIEVHEGVEGGNGEVIIIYNYDGAELTPELLAKTLEELSTQTSLQKAAQNQQALAAEDAVICLPNQNVPTLNAQSEPELLGNLDLPFIKVECQDSPDLNTVQQAADEGLTSSTHQATELIQIPEKIKVENASENLDENMSLEQVKEDELMKDITVDLVTVTNSQAGAVPCQSDAFLQIDQNHKDEISEDEETPQDHMCDKCSFVSQKRLELQRHRKTEHNEQEPFECHHCDKRFKLELSLEIHKLAHSKKSNSVLGVDLGFIHKIMKFFSCPLCDFQYQKKGQLTNHMKVLHKGEEYVRCSKCYYSCLTQEELNEHMASSTHDEDKRTLCPLCGTATKDIRQHLRRVHNSDRPYLCTSCGFKAKTHTNLTAHMITHDPVKRVSCSQCQYKCRTKDQLKRHMVKHSTEKNVKCSICNFACKTSMSLKRHMQIHQSHNKYICSICDFSTHDKLLLRQHKSKEHILKACHKCKECDIEFDRVMELKTHALAVHKSDRVHFCSYCDFSGHTATELRTHMQIHFGKFSYKCSLCSYTCRQKGSFRRHMERHNKVKKFACTLCNYACVEKHDLQKHYTHCHSEEKPFRCPHCSYKCKFKARLNNHIACVHSDVKPYFCKHCSYAGKSAENLKKHMANHGVVVKSLQCVLCDYATAEKAKLKRHMRVHVKKAIFQ